MKGQTSHSHKALLENKDVSHNFFISNSTLSRKAIERLDLLLLVVESLDLNASQAMLLTAEQMGLLEQFPNRVALWKSRCYNPLRKTTRRGSIPSTDSDSLIMLLNKMSERLYPIIRQLISSREPKEINNQRYTIVAERLRDLIKERMNTKRTAVKKILNKSYSELFVKESVQTLSLSVGISGFIRLKASLLELH